MCQSTKTNTSGKDHLFLVIFYCRTRSFANQGKYSVQFVIDLLTPSVFYKIYFNIKGIQSIAEYKEN